MIMENFCCYLPYDNAECLVLLEHVTEKYALHYRGAGTNTYQTLLHIVTIDQFHHHLQSTTTCNLCTTSHNTVRLHEKLSSISSVVIVPQILI